VVQRIGAELPSFSAVLGLKSAGRALRGSGSFGNRLRDRRGHQRHARAVPGCRSDTWALLRPADAGRGRRPGYPGGEIGVLELSTNTRIASLMKGR
jgi:hypothetical protein